MRPFDKNVTTETITGTVTVTAITQQKDLDFFDIRSLVSGLVQVFAKKIHRLPSQHATKIYKMFINYLEHHYQQPKIFEHCNQIRYLVCLIFYLNSIIITIINIRRFSIVL